MYFHMSLYAKAVELSSPHKTGLAAPEASLSTMFSYWYLTHINPNADGKQVLNTQSEHSLFAEFLKDTPATISLLMQIDAKQILKDQKANLQEGRMILKQLDAGTISNAAVPTFTRGNSNSILINPSNLPGGVWMDSGKWLMVQISYYVFHATWWLGGWSVTYGEHDTYNTLFAGSTAQQEFNSVMNSGWSYAFVVGVLVTILGFGLALAAPTLGISTIASGLTVAALASVVQSDYLKQYESTYANEPSGNKYLWTALTMNFYYPWVTVVGTLASTISWYGYYADGSTLSIFPGWATWVSLGIGSTVVASFAGYCQGIAKSIGTNYWSYQGQL